MAPRREFERPIWVDGERGKLFVSSGPADDYLELTLPASIGPDSPCLAGLEERAGHHDLAIQIYLGLPVLAGITALYINTPELKAAPPAQRIQAILGRVAGVIPGIDFGELLPQPAAVVPVEEPAPPVEAQEGPAPLPAVPIRHPDFLQLSRRSSRVERARELASAGQLRKAARLLEEDSASVPGDPVGGSLLDAIRLLERREKRLRKEPASLQANLEVGFSYLVLERNQEAAQALDRSARLAPRLYLAHLLLGIALHRLGRTVPARSAYLKAGRLRPGDRVPLDLIAALDRGEPPIGLVESGPMAGAGPGEAAGPGQRLVYAG